MVEPEVWRAGFKGHDLDAASGFNLVNQRIVVLEESQGLTI